MADDTDVVVKAPGFEPEPVPEALADIELNGLNPAEESTDSEPVEEVQEETSEEQPPAEETDTSTEEEPETTEEPVAPTTEEQKPVNELTGAERRLAEKAQRDYIAEQRQQIREAEQALEPDDTARRLEILEAKEYVNYIERNRSQIISDNMRATSEIPLFNPSAPEYQPALYQRALERFNDSFVVTDPDSGEVLYAQDRNGNNVSLYQYLQQEAASMSQVLSATQQASQQQAQKAETKMRAKAVNPSNPGKVSSSGDELADLLDKIGDVPLV